MAGRGKSWTPEEKFQLLLRILKANGGQLKISWKDVELPEGRTVKACIHALEAIKKEAGFESNPTPKKTPMKKGKDVEEGDEIDEPPKKKRKTPVKKTAPKSEAKVEESELDDNMTPEKPILDEMEEGGFTQVKNEEGEDGADLSEELEE